MDFHQTRDLVTLHHLREWMPLVEEGSGRPKKAVVIPLRASDGHDEVFRSILFSLSAAEWFDYLVLPVNGDLKGLEVTLQKEWNRWGGRATLVVLDSRSPCWDVIAARAALVALPVPLKEGKGDNIWKALGWLLARDVDSIVIHDGDIRAYHHKWVASLERPLDKGGFGFHFTKAFYARIGDRLHGRLTRLLITPLIAALGEVAGGNSWIDFLGRFRFILSGEMGVTASFASRCRLVPGFGLELRFLHEAFRLLPRPSCAQVEWPEAFEHRHHPLESTNGSGGNLVEMARELLPVLRQDCESLGMVWDNDGILRSFVEAQDWFLSCYEKEARYAGLPANDHREKETAKAFRSVVIQFLNQNHVAPPHLPAWADLFAADPAVKERLLAE